MYEITGGTTRPFFRPPYGAYDQRVLLQVIRQGYLPIYWTLDSLDWREAGADMVLQRVTTSLTPQELHGSIILAHCGSFSTAEALPAMLDRFDEFGLEVRTLSDAL